MNNQLYERKLEEHREDLLVRLNRCRGLGMDKGSDFLDLVQASVLQDSRVANYSRLDDELRQVEEALRRIDEGAYGDCLDCGKGIPAKRLKATPWAEYCVDCSAGQPHGYHESKTYRGGDIVLPGDGEEQVDLGELVDEGLVRF